METPGTHCSVRGDPHLTPTAAILGPRPGPEAAHSPEQRGAELPSQGWDLKAKSMLEPLGKQMPNALVRDEPSWVK